MSSALVTYKLLIILQVWYHLMEICLFSPLEESMQFIPSETLVIDRKRRANMPFYDLDLRPPVERICDFGDVVIDFSAERAMREAARCIHCPDPAPCMIACPPHNDIPSAMWLIEQGRFSEADELYHQTSSLPEICGRVCPHESLCQGSCVLNKFHTPVLTGQLETFAVDFKRRHEGRNIPIAPPTGKRVAVIGAGPAGLGCADQLVQRGHEVTIFESKPTAGGLLVYGIPTSSCRRMFGQKNGPSSSGPESGSFPILISAKTRRLKIYSRKGSTPSSSA